MKHSPHPWRATAGNCGAMTGLMNAEGMPVAMLGVTSALNPADVVLIEAAPELLDVVRRLADAYCDGYCSGLPHGLGRDALALVERLEGGAA